MVSCFCHVRTRIRRKRSRRALQLLHSRPRPATPRTALNRNRAVRACVRALDQEKIDLLILDINLSDFNGANMVHHMREKGVAKDVPVIIVSGVSDDEILDAVSKLGVKEVIKKPYQLEDLLKKVKKELK